MPTSPTQDTRRLALISTDDGVSISATIVEASPYGLSVVLPAKPSSMLALSSRVELEVGWIPGEPPLEVQAFVRDLATADSLTRCELEFDLEGPMGRNLTPETLKLIFNRRRSERVTLERAEQPVVRMTDERTGETVEGWLRDISTGGIGLRLLLSDVPDLADTESVRLEFTLPGGSPSFKLAGSLRNCRPQGAYVVLGFEFERPGSDAVDFERDEILEFVSQRLASASGA